MVPTDFSDNAKLAFGVAQELARLAGAILQVVHVAESERRTAAKKDLRKPGATKEEIREAVATFQNSRFAEFTAGSVASVDVHCRAIQGNPHVVVVNVAKEMDADLVVVGLRGTGAVNTIRATLMGSVAKTLVKESPCPVVVVRPDHKAR